MRLMKATLAIPLALSPGEEELKNLELDEFHNDTTHRHLYLQVTATKLDNKKKSICASLFANPFR